MTGVNPAGVARVANKSQRQRRRIGPMGNSEVRDQGLTAIKLMRLAGLTPSEIARVGSWLAVSVKSTWERCQIADALQLDLRPLREAILEDAG